MSHETLPILPEDIQVGDIILYTFFREVQRLSALNIVLESSSECVLVTNIPTMKSGVDHQRLTRMPFQVIGNHGEQVVFLQKAEYVNLVSRVETSCTPRVAAVNL